MIGYGGGLVTQLCLTLVIQWTVAHWASLSMGFPRQEYWSRLPFPSLGALLNSDQSSISSIFCISRQILYHCANPYIRINKRCRSKNLPRILIKWAWNSLCGWSHQGLPPPQPGVQTVVQTHIRLIFPFLLPWAYGMLWCQKSFV